MFRNISAILFDIDNTLYDRDEAQKQVLQLLVHEFSNAFNRLKKDEIQTAFHESDRFASDLFLDGASADTVVSRRMTKFAEIIGLDEGLAIEITAFYIKRYPGIYAPVKDAQFVLEKLSPRFKLGIISNSTPGFQYRKLDTLGITNLFDCVVLSEEIGIRKPDTGIFRRAVRLLDKAPDECMYVGDSYENDIAGAFRAGMNACWYNPEDESPPDDNIKIAYNIKSLKGLLKIIDTA